MRSRFDHVTHTAQLISVRALVPVFPLRRQLVSQREYFHRRCMRRLPAEFATPSKSVGPSVILAPMDLCVRVLLLIVKCGQSTAVSLSLV